MKMPKKNLDMLKNIKDEDIDCSEIPPLDDDFWTNAKSNGFLKVQRVSKKRTISFSEAKKKWPKRRDWKTIR